MQLNPRSNATIEEEIPDTLQNSDEAASPDKGTGNNTNPQETTKNYQSIKVFWRYGSVFASVWLLAVVMIWLWLHAPFMPPLPSNLVAVEVISQLADTVLNLLLLPLILLSAGAVGLRLLGWIHFKGFNQAEKLVFAIALGLGVCGFAILILGVAGIIGWPISYGLLVGGLVLNYPQTIQIVSNIRPGFKVGVKWWQNAGLTKRLLAAYIATVLILTLLMSLLPPVAWDSLMYHLVAPNLYLQDNRIGPLTQIFPSNYPFGAEMLFTWAIGLHNDSLAQSIHWSFGLLTLVSLILMSNRFFTGLSFPKREMVGLLAASLFISIPLVQTLLTYAYTDLMVGLYAFLAFYLLLITVVNQEVDWAKLAILAGVMGGLSFGGKYWAVLALVGVGLAFLIIGAQEKLRISRLVSIAVLFGIVAALIAVPWLVRNWLFSDNPIAPFLFGSRGWQPAELNSFSTGKGVQLNLFYLLALPWQLSVNGQTGGLWDATITPLFLGLAPLIIFAVIRERITNRALFLAIGIQFAIWAFVLTLNSTLSETRALTPAFPLLALICAYGLVILADIKATTIFRNFAYLIVGLYLISNLFNQFTTFNYSTTLPMLTGLETKDAYLEEELGSYYRAARYISASLPQQAQILSWLEPRSYYFNRSTKPDFHLDEIFYYTSKYPDANLLADELKKEGVTNLLISERGLNFLLETPEYNRVEATKTLLPVLAQLKANHLTLLYQEAGEYSFYSIH